MVDNAPPVPSLTGMLAELDKSPALPPTPEETKKHELQLLTDEEKHRQAWQFKMNGVPMQSIAKIFGVDARTVYRWFSVMKADWVSQMEIEPSVNHFAGEIMHLEELESLCLYEASQIGNDSKKFDVTLGAVVDSPNKAIDAANKRGWIKEAGVFRMARIKLMLETGVIPREADRLYRTMEEEGKAGQVVEDVTPVGVPLDRKQLIAEVLERMTKGRTLS